MESKTQGKIDLVQINLKTNEVTTRQEDREISKIFS